MVATETIKDAMWLRCLFDELSQGQKVIFVHCDSQSVIHLTKDSMHHIDVKYHFIWEVIAQGDIVVGRIGTKDNPTNMMTKSLPITKFDLCSDMVGLCITWYGGFEKMEIDDIMF